MSEISKTTADITIGGEVITIQKLKAGKFYEAQKVIAEIFRSASSFSSAKGTSTGKDLTEDKAPDMKDLEERDIISMVGMFEKLPTQVASFVAICADQKTGDLLEKAYPEEITDAFSVCLELNNVLDNLKKSAAPMEKLGADENKDPSNQ